MAAPIAFESQTDRRRERDEKRKAQDLILEKAKDEHDRKERQKEAHKLRGDDKWMLSSVTDRIQAEDDKLKSKKHKKEKDKKKKKKKREKNTKLKTNQHESNSGFSSDEDVDSGAMEWVENHLASSKLLVQNVITSSDQNKKTQRDDWMSNPFTMTTYSRDDIRREKAAREENAETEKEKEQKMLLDNPGRSDRELNPFWKDGGTGLPDEKQSTPTAKVGIADAGVGWLRKQYQRIVERSEEEGRSVEELAAERWGSLEKYHELLAKAGSAKDRPWHRDGDRHRQHRDTDSGTFPRRDRGMDSRRDRGMDPRRDRGEGRGRDANRGEDRYREVGRGRDGQGAEDGGRESERDSDRNSHKYRDRLLGRPQGRNRSPDRDGGRTRDRYNDRESKSSSSVSRRDETSKMSGRTFMRPSESDDRPRHKDLKSGSLGTLGGLRGKFSKPGEESSDGKDDSRRDRFSGSDRRQGDETPAWKKKTFMKPNEDGEERSQTPSSSSTSSARASSSAPAWKKQTAAKSDEPAETSQNLEYGSRSHSSSESSSSSKSESDSSSDTESNRSPSPPPRILSETEMNQLGAKIVRAELMGNEDLAKKLKAQLEASRQAKANQATKGLTRTGPSAPSDKKDVGASDEEKEVVLTRVDRTGQSWPLPEQSGPGPSDKGKKRKKKQSILTHDKDGQRERYFGDDDQQELRDMVRKERMSSGEDQLRLFNKVANKALKKLTDDHTLDDMFVSVAAQKRPGNQEEERQKAAAISQHRKMAASMSKCPFCLDSPEMQKHLIIALGIKVYLCLPATQSLTEGHCFIIPMQHTVASTALDEDVWSEMQIYRKGLTRMFEDQDRDAIFLETCMNPRGQRHMVMECIPLPKEIGDMAPIYFKKAIQESESEWSQNKKLVDTRKKDIRKSVPQGFPYFSVDFGLDGGFAHVIEDEKVFPHYFGKEIIGGIMDLDPQMWRRPHRQNFEDQRRKVLQFGEWWKPFDWTQRIGKD